MSTKALNEIKSIAVEAYQIAMQMPGLLGPRPPGSAWPEVAGDYSPIVLRPTASQISQSDAFWESFAFKLGEPDRRELLSWLQIKCHKDRTLRGWCEKNGLLEHKYKRKIDAIFQKLVDRSNIKLAMRYEPDVYTARILDDKQENREPLQKSPSHTQPPELVEVDPAERARIRKSLAKKLMKNQQRAMERRAKVKKLEHSS